MKKKLVILTGAGISAESGLATFRGMGGLWNGYKVTDVASPQGFRKNPELVLNFYNFRRKDAAKAQPNAAHHALLHLEEQYDTTIITQNVDDLHERAGSTKVLHLHGKLREARSTTASEQVFDINDRDINLGDLCPLGSQLRPNIVWFGEEVPLIPRAIDYCLTGDIFIVIGTSLAVYPAASLINYVPESSPKYVIDPNIPSIPSYIKNVYARSGKASQEVPILVAELLGRL